MDRAARPFLTTTVIGGATLIAWFATLFFTYAVGVAVAGEGVVGDGNFTSAAAVVAAAVALVILRAGGGELGAFRVRARPLLLGVAATLAVSIAAGLISQLLSRPEVPEVILELRRTTWPPLLVFTVVVVAPVWEELFFRGLLLGGWARSRAGPVAAVVLSSAAWALIHLDYDLFDVGTIFVLGLLFGYTRLRTGSVGLVILMHAAFNALAVAQLYLVVE